MPIVKIKICR